MASSTASQCIVRCYFWAQKVDLNGRLAVLCQQAEKEIEPGQLTKVEPKRL
jgi:hypothetical protein